MRHRVKGRKLGRTASHRKATLTALATSLLKHKRIKTTLAKAKETRGFVEKLITKAKKDDLHAKKMIIDVIKDKEVVKELFAEIIPKIGVRPGGYTRVIKLGNRLGDAASMAIIELVDYNDVINAREEERKEVREVKAKEKKEAEVQQEAEEAQFVEEAPAATEEKK
jgi:large subunit ribosomal protein L17